MANSLLDRDVAGSPAKNHHSWSWSRHSNVASGVAGFSATASRTFALLSARQPLQQRDRRGRMPGDVLRTSRTLLPASRSNSATGVAGFRATARRTSESSSPASRSNSATGVAGCRATARRTSDSSSPASRSSSATGVAGCWATARRTQLSSSPASRSSSATGVAGCSATSAADPLSSSPASRSNSATGVAGCSATMRRTYRVLIAGQPLQQRDRRGRMLGDGAADPLILIARQPLQAAATGVAGCSATARRTNYSSSPASRSSRATGVAGCSATARRTIAILIARQPLQQRRPAWPDARRRRGGPIESSSPASRSSSGDRRGRMLGDGAADLDYPHRPPAAPTARPAWPDAGRRRCGHPNPHRPPAAPDCSRRATGVAGCSATAAADLPILIARQPLQQLFPQGDRRGRMLRRRRSGPDESSSPASRSSNCSRRAAGVAGCSATA